jgi:hypothetical protein
MIATASESTIVATMTQMMILVHFWLLRIWIVLWDGGGFGDGVAASHDANRRALIDVD